MLGFLGGLLGPMLQLGGMALGYQSIIKQGKEAKKQAYEAARMRLQESANIAASTQEKLHDLEVEKYYARGAARAQAASAGAKVGTGSTLTTENQIMGAYRRKQTLLAEETGRQRGLLQQEAGELKRMGKQAEKSSKRSAFASLLTGGFQFGQSMQWWGV